MSRAIPLKVLGCCVRGVPQRARSAGRGFDQPPAGTLARSCTELVHRHLVRRAIRELHLFDDRMLKDIGISRSEIESVVRHGRMR